MTNFKLRLTTKTAIFTLLIAATSMITMFNPNAIAQTINSTQEIITNEAPQVTPLQYRDSPIVNDHTPDREYVLDIRGMNKTVFCLAQNAYFEAGGESFKNKIAVTTVVKTRSMTDGYPKTECGVVQESTDRNNRRMCQFSWWCTGRREIPLYDRAGQIKPQVYQMWYDSVRAALLVHNNAAGDSVKGATHFYAHKVVRPAWASKMRLVAVIGNHTFVAPK